jgi:hypothetical protein
MAELFIPLIAEFKGKKAFDQANKATNTLDKGVKRLGATLGATFGAQQFLRYGKNAVKAFVENEKSARRLEMVVKNLGQAFETPFIEQNLDKISAKFGYQGEILREAYQKLITSTGSATKANELFNLSLDVSAGSGFDLLTVNQDLAAAYVGQTRSLRKYNLGLTQAELKNLKFDDAVKKLTASFKGAGETELTTYAGKMRVLTEAADNAQEIIGGGLVDALALLSGEGNTVEPLAESMSDFSLYVSDAIVGVALLIDKLKKVPGIGTQNALTSKSFLISPTTSALAILKKGLDYVSKTGEEFRTPGMGGYPSSALGPGYIDPDVAKRNKIEADRLKIEKQRAALAKKNLDTQKKQNALVKASQTLDLERIGIAAALKGNISETDQLSLRLQLALLNENDEAATRLSALLTAAVQRQNELNAMLLATPEAPNPFRNWKLPDTFSSAGGALSLEDLRGRSGALVVPTPSLTTPPLAMPETVPNPYAGGALPGFERRELPGGRGFIDVPTPRINVTVELDGKVVSDAIRDSTLNESLSGSFSEVNRTNRFAPQGVIAE